MRPPPPKRHVLVIRLGALGDFVLSFAPFDAIRAHHRSDYITLLTTAPFAELARKSPWFDRILVDARPTWRQPLGVLRLVRALRGFDLVYDLQTSRRTSAYFFLAGRPAWSGIAAGCAWPHADLGRDRMHTLERQRDQLVAAGITHFPPPDLSWLRAAAHPTLPAGDFSLLVPGAAPHRPEKRWPAERFAALAALLAGRGLRPVIVGTREEAAAAEQIRAACPAAVDLSGRTDLPGLAAMAARAALAVGNDTGPMHLAAAMGCRCLVLFGPASDPALTSPRGPGGAWPKLVRVEKLAELPVERVAAALSEAA